MNWIVCGSKMLIYKIGVNRDRGLKRYLQLLTPLYKIFPNVSIFSVPCMPEAQKYDPIKYGLMGRGRERIERKRGNGEEERE